MFFYDLDYLLYVFIPMVLLAGICQIWVKSAVTAWSRVPSSSGVTGEDAARGILRAAGIHDVRVEVSEGWLSDHYDPRHKVVRLSRENFSGRSVTALAIAAHEVGHAIQHARAFAPLVLRNLAVPVASIGSKVAYVAIMIGFVMGGLASEGPGRVLLYIGVLGLAAIAVFQLINLPVEFDASRRALQVLPSMGILSAQETVGARRVLTAAAMTYVAATVAALAQLLYWAWRLGLLGGRRE